MKHSGIIKVVTIHPDGDINVKFTVTHRDAQISGGLAHKNYRTD